MSRATGLIVDTIGTLPWHVYRNDTERLPTPPWISDPQALRLDGRIVDTATNSTRPACRPSISGANGSCPPCGGATASSTSRSATNRAPRSRRCGSSTPTTSKSATAATTSPTSSCRPRQIIHLRGQTPIIDGRGSGVLTRFAGELATVTALRAYVAGAFTAGVPAGYLKTSQPNVTQEQADTLKSRWMSQHGGRRSIAVLNSTTEFHPLDLVARSTPTPPTSPGSPCPRSPSCSGYPPGMLGGPTGDTLTYSTNEMRMLELYQLTLLPWIGRIEAVLNAQLPAGTKPRIEVDGLLRADIKTRMEAYAIGIQTGVLTRDEARALENRPPLAQTGQVL